MKTTAVPFAITSSSLNLLSEDNPREIQNLHVFDFDEENDGKDNGRYDGKDDGMDYEKDTENYNENAIPMDEDTVEPIGDPALSKKRNMTIEEETCTVFQD